jgi:hemerythrin-like domain-containing protein
MACNDTNGQSENNHFRKHIMQTLSALQIIRDEHASLAAMLQSMRFMVQMGPSDDAKKFFDVLRGMLFYIDEFPERLHHPKESNLLFSKIAKLAPPSHGDR